MTIHLGYVPANSTLYIPFCTYNSSGASVTLTGLAATDIEIYKAGSTTQRASDNGYALLDTDGIDFDGVTGLHGFSIDLSDNTTAGFYAAGSFYWVVVSTVTIDSQTVTLLAATFFIGPQEANVSQFGGTAGTFSSGRPEVNTSHIAGSAVSTTTAQLGVNVVAISTDATAADTLESLLDGGGGTLTANITGNLSGSAGSVTGAVGSVTGNVGGNVTGSVGSLAAQAKSDVNAEVLDVLNVDTFAQPGQGTPAATTTIRLMLAYLYKAWRNKSTSTSSQYSLYNDDAATVDQKSALTDDATTYTKDEVATGP